MPRRYNAGRRRAISSEADHGPEERWQHNHLETIITNEAGDAALCVRDEAMLDRWYLAGAITTPEHTAGLRLRADYVYAGLAPALTGRYSGSHAGVRQLLSYWESPAERRNHQAEAAYQRWSEAVRAVVGVASLLITVACEDKHCPWRDRTRLREALIALAQFYETRDRAHARFGYRQTTPAASL